MADFGATWVPAAQGNYDTSRSPVVDLIVDHHTASTFDAALNRFTTAGSKVSAHFIVDRDGTVYQCVDIQDTAYHSGDYPTNQRSLGIEHVSIGPNGEVDAFTDAQYAASSALHAAIAGHFGFPLDPTHVCPHSQIVPTECPGALDITRILQGVSTLTPDQEKYILDQAAAFGAWDASQGTLADTVAELRKLVAKQQADITSLQKGGGADPAAVAAQLQVTVKP